MTDLVYKQAVPELADFGGAASVRGDIIVDEPGETAYIVCNGQVVPIGGATGVAIGDPVIGGLVNRVLFINPAGILAQDDNFRFVPSGTPTLFIGPVTGPGAYSSLAPAELYLEGPAAAQFANLSGTTGELTLSSLIGVGSRNVVADATGKLIIGSGGVLPTFSPTIIPFADGAGELTESASLFWDGNYANAPGVKLNSGGASTVIRQNGSVLEGYVASDRIFNFTLNGGSGNAIYNFRPSASGLLGISGADPAGNDCSVYALNTSTSAAGNAGFWVAHNSASGGSAYLDLYRYAASVSDNGWRVASVQSRSDSLSIYAISAGPTSDLKFEFRRDAGLFFKPVSRPTADGTFGYIWADTEGSPALSGPNGDVFRWFQTDKNLSIGDDAGSAWAAGSNDNVALGWKAFGNGGTATGFGNVAAGTNVMGKATGADQNVGLGYLALEELLSGDLNVAIGSLAMEIATTAKKCTAVGAEALINEVAGAEHVAIGIDALANQSTTNTDGTGGNTAVGANAAAVNQSGLRLVAVGRNAINNIDDSDGVTAVGYEAGTTLTDGDDCIFIGDGADGVSVGDNQIAIGAGVATTAANETRIGNASCTAIFLRGLLGLFGNLTAGAPGLTTNKLVIDVDGVQYYVPLTAV